MGTDPGSRQPEIEACLNQAYASFRSNNFLQAESLCRQALEIQPENPDAFLLLGMVYGAQNRLEEARNWLTRAYDIAPAIPNYLIQLAGGLGRVGLHEQAVSCLETVHGLQPHDERVLTNLGAAQCLKGDFQAAVTSFNNAVAINPQCTEAWLNLGITYKQMGMTGLAEQKFRKVLDIHPRHEMASSSLGAILQLEGRTEEAIEIYRNALTITPQSADLCFGLYGTIFETSGPEEAASLLEKAVAGNPGHFFARTHLAIMLDRLGRSVEAERHLQIVRTKTPEFMFNVDSWYYARNHFSPDTRLFTLSNSGLAHAVNNAVIEGYFMEFGVWQGRSINFISSCTSRTVHGFDSFEGIPDDWEGMPSGSYSTYGQPAEVNANVVFHKGWFEDSVPAFARDHTGPVALMNIDCDTYQSTKTIFDTLGDRIVAGTVIVFDEYFCFPNWQQHEYQAFQEYLADSGHRYEYLFFNLYTKQAGVIIKA